MVNKNIHLYPRDNKGRYIGGFTISLEKRFNDNIDKKNDTDCWIWQGTYGKRGYGTICRNSKMVYAHRVSWELYHNSIIPNGMNILHHCDNPSCVNPHHLFLGTQSDNVKDMKSKGRGNYNNPLQGERNGNSKLTEKDVYRIKNLFETYSVSELSKKFNVHRKTIYDIINGKMWKHIQRGIYNGTLAFQRENKSSD